ncbi:hypothetical protein [Sphingomonas sp. R86520]|uniref:hypothetical protein n=1 Tax=Sphingomonas sp. R86520 TaxID=3093859 RepID=UPI0036D43356
MGLSRLFRSRWSALFWAAGILWTAYDVANDAPAPAPAAGNASVSTDATGETFDAHDLAVLAHMGG